MWSEQPKSATVLLPLPPSNTAREFNDISANPPASHKPGPVDFAPIVRLADSASVFSILSAQLRNYDFWTPLLLYARFRGLRNFAGEAQVLPRTSAWENSIRHCHYFRYREIDFETRNS